MAGNPGLVLEVTTSESPPNQKAESEFGTTKLGENPHPWKHIKPHELTDHSHRSPLSWPASTRMSTVGFFHSDAHALAFLFPYLNKTYFVLTLICLWNFSYASQGPGGCLTAQRLDGATVPGRASPLHRKGSSNSSIGEEKFFLYPSRFFWLVK